MRRSAFVILSVYILQALLGHAGLHALSNGHSHSHIDDQRVVNGVQIVSCFHSADEEATFDHSHCCHGHSHSEPLSSPGEKNPAPAHQHDEESCQICHHLAHVGTIAVCSAYVPLVEMLYVVSESEERFYHAVVVSLPLTRGPPVRFA